MTKASDNVFPKLITSEGAAPATPSSGQVKIYAKTDGLVYSKDDAGTETLMSSGLATNSYTAPSVRAVGTSATGTSDVTPGLPTGHVANDILLLFVQSDNQAVAAPSGYAQLGPQPSLGTANAAGGTRLAVFWKRDGGSEAAPTVTDTGDHTLAQIMAVSGCVTSGDPFISVGQTRKTTASTTGTGAAGATHLPNCMVVQAFAHALDSASAVFSAWTNASLSSVTEQIDVATADGNGGGIGVATGVMALQGSFVATTVTETSTTDVGSCFYLIPAGGSTAGAIDRQVFLTTATTDTWTKPTGAKDTRMTAIGGGASGSAGRNAATASGGGGGGGGAWDQKFFAAHTLPASLTVTCGAGGAATANSDGAASTAGGASIVARTGPAATYIYVDGGFAATAAASGSGGAGGGGGGIDSTAGAPGAFARFYGGQSAIGGTGGTTAAAGSQNEDRGGGGGAGGGTTQGAAAGGNGNTGGGGGGRAAGTQGNGGAAFGVSGGASVGASGTDATDSEHGGGGGAGGTSTTGPGGSGGWPGGGGGGGGSQSGAQRGGAGGDGCVTITTTC